MDDNNFDDLLKNKLKNYEDPTFDPSALDGLHERLGDFQPAPWYTSNGLRIALISSLFLLTAINTYFFIHNSKLEQTSGYTLSKPKLTSSNTIDSLKVVIEQLQCKAAEQNNTAHPSSTLASPTFQLRLLNETGKTENKTDIFSSDITYRLGMGSRKNISSEVYNKLKAHGRIVEEDGEIFLLIREKQKPASLISFHARLSDLLAPIEHPGTLQLIAMSATKSNEEKPKVVIPEGKSSLAARNALEKHYFNKLGIQLAPHVDLVKGIFSQGSGEIMPRVGFTADWLISPRFSIESGFDYSTTQNSLSHDQIPPYAQYNPQLGSCEAATLTKRLISIPLSVKYRRWVSYKSQLIVRAGYTPYGVLTRQSQYNYVRPDINGVSDADRTTTLNNYHDFSYFGNTISTSAGLTMKRDKNKGAWETSLYYEHSMGSGFDKKAMQFVGLRAAYWFKVR